MLSRYRILGKLGTDNTLVVPPPISSMEKARSAVKQFFAEDVDAVASPRCFGAAQPQLETAQSCDGLDQDCDGTGDETDDKPDARVVGTWQDVPPGTVNPTMHLGGGRPWRLVARIRESL